MCMYKSDFQPIMKRYALALKIILLMAGVMFIVRSFVITILYRTNSKSFIGYFVDDYLYIFIDDYSIGYRVR